MLSMEVAYRTKMTISPTQTGRDNTIMLKSDHFLKDISPKHTRYHHSSRKTCEKKVVDLDKPMRIGAFVDPSRTKQYTEDDYILPETPPFSWLLRKTKEDPADGEEKPAAGAVRAAAAPPQSTEDASVCNNNNNATRNLEVAEESKEKDINGSSPSSQDLTRRPSSRWSSSRVVPAEDEKLLKELHFPFATTNTPISDLAKFYRDCFNAPPLQGFSDSPLDDDIEVEDLTKQLEQFETSLGDFDSLVTSLCCQSVMVLTISHLQQQTPPSVTSRNSIAIASMRPHLQGFSDSPLDDDIEVEDLTKQLEQFETSLGDFDSLVTSLCCQSVDDNLNS
uniref:Uncharacterized protein n=1 Tax=Lutzomyia longipalpis TaxID=7200 RepID=A0A1B0CL18_LUTLO